MQAGSARRILSLLGSLLVLIVIVAGIVFGQANGGTNPTATAGRPTAFATSVVIVPGVTATATMAAAAPTTRTLPTATSAPTAANRPAPTATSPPRAQGPAPAPNDGLPTIAFTALPAEARQTIVLIDRGGPFPYDRDGITFGNREGLLPAQSNGYYREYTVVTPGSSDRGARRIIGGRDGQLYYTDDHYESFRRVVR